MFKRGNIRSGYTLVEILVVIAIISVLAGISVAGVAKLGDGSKQELSRSARHLHTLLHAAKVYADTFNVRTAVVYNMDNYVDPPFPDAMAQPLQDPVTELGIRVITSAAVLYELPRGTATPFIRQGGPESFFVPTPDEAGQFRVFEGEQVLMLNNLDPGPSHFQSFYYRPEARYNPETELDPTSGNNLFELGMDSVSTFIGDTGPFAVPGTPAFTNYVSAPFAAHIFAPGGRLEPGAAPAGSAAGARERYTLFVAPPPQADIEQHLINPDDPQGERVFRKIHLYRSTGRIKTES